MRTLIAEDSLNRYARILQALIPNAAGFSVCDTDGSPVQALNFDDATEIAPVLERLTARQPDWASIQDVMMRAAPGEECSLLTVGLRDTHGNSVAAVAIMTVGSCEQDSVTTPLQFVTDCIRHEIMQEMELESMAHELTERYEELNLVYHTEDQVNFFRQGRAALQSLAQNCLDYLNVGLSALILKDKSISICCSHPKDPIPDANFIKLQLAGRLYEWVAENNDTIVINEMSDSMAVTLIPGVPCRVLSCPIQGNGGEVVGMLVTVNDFSKPRFSNSDKNLLQVMARKASKLVIANYDPLTGLMNRSGYEDFLESALTESHTGEVDNCLLHINIDQLHIVNDTVGREAGDAVIRAIAVTLESHIRSYDLLSRLGGDEFGVLLRDCSFNDAVDFANRVCSRISETGVEFEGKKFPTTVSIGVVMMTSATDSVAQVVGTAELACSVAKDQGQNRVETYRRDDVDMIRREEQMHLVADIQTALAEDRFKLFSQPIESLDPSDQLHHTEILLRLLDEDGEIHAPGKFIPAAERYHLMPAIDRWVVNNALTMLSTYDVELLRTGVYAINLSGQSLNDKDFLEFVHEEIGSSSVPAERICFELTETTAISNLTTAIRFMDSLRRIGCTFSLDDFGSGISSFGYLKSLPVSYLKIDGSFVKDAVTDETSAAMVTAINQVGHTMQLLTVAEFVEDDAIKSRMKDIGVDYVQGYGIGRPVPLARRLRELFLPSASVAS